MSDNIPFEIQMEIIKNVSDIRSLIRFRSVSNRWKSFIDTSEFIKGYDTQPRSHVLTYKSHYKWDYQDNYCLEDVDMETFEVQTQEASSLLNQYRLPFFVGASHGLLCWNGFNDVNKKDMLVIWNPSIRKSIGIAVPKYTHDPHDLWFGYKKVYGFGVCPITSDPTVIQVLCADNMPRYGYMPRYEYKPWHAKVFTLNSGAWDDISTDKLPRQSITIVKSSQVVIDRFIYWGACEMTFGDDGDDGEPTINYMLVSFDIITKEFNVVDLPDSLRNGSYVSVSKLRDSLVVSKHISVAGRGVHCGVWVMEHDSSFRKLFTIGAPVEVVGFKENGETIVRRQYFPKLDIYDPCSQQIKNLVMSEKLEGLFFMGSYKESLLLLDHPDLHIYSEDS